MKNLVILLFMGVSPLFGQIVKSVELTFPIPVSIREAIIDEYGNYYFTANHTSSTFDTSMSILIKTDSMFQVLWAKRYKILRRDDLKAISILSDGNLMIGGSARQDFSLQVGGCLIKIDTSGAVIWHKVYDGTGDDRVIGIFEQPDSSITALIRYGVSSRSDRLIRVTDMGELIAQVDLEADSRPVSGDQIIEGRKGTFFLSGDQFDASIPKTIMFVSATHQTTSVWYKEYQFTSNVSPLGMTLTADSAIVLCGYIFNDTLQNVWEALAVKMDTMGNVIWAKRVSQDQPFNFFFSEVMASLDSGVVLVGRVQNVNSSDAIAVQLDQDGNLVWATGQDASLQEVYSEVLVRADGQLVTVNSGADNSYLSLMSSNGLHACSEINFSPLVTDIPVSVIPKTPVADDPGLVAVDLPLEVTDLTASTTLVCETSVSLEEKTWRHFFLSPNPNAGAFDLILPESTGEIHLSLLDLAGRGQKISWTREGAHIRCIGENLSPGMYVLVAEDGIRRVSQKILITD